MVETSSQEKIMLSAISGHESLSNLRRGIEKESLRITRSGELSKRPHPTTLGSALTHPNITTDFSEAQLELITGVHSNATNCLQELEDVHRFVQSQIDGELMWGASMPCMIGPDHVIPIGQYGSSNIGKAKSIYRTGLSFRYGALMQTISGIHYNFSIPDDLWTLLAASQNKTPTVEFVTNSYFDLIRNFRRHSWLLIYLFGASPAVCNSFIRDLPHGLESFDGSTSFLPYATSLRMGRLGYQSNAQSSLYVSYNSLEDYAKTISQALTEPYEPYVTYGVKVEGKYRQLNTALLQIENEFYGTIRPKPKNRRGERPLESLVRNGTDYVEVRCMDLNPFTKLGIDTPTIHFLDTFLLYCLLTNSEPDNRTESKTILRNQLKVVEEGRRPGLQLRRKLKDVLLSDWAHELLEKLEPISEVLDQANGTQEHSASLKMQRQKIVNSALTPSAQIIHEMNTEQQSFFQFGIQQSNQHKKSLNSVSLKADTSKHFKSLSEKSLLDQKIQESEETESFEDFLSKYLSLRIEKT